MAGVHYRLTVLAQFTFSTSSTPVVNQLSSKSVKQYTVREGIKKKKNESLTAVIPTLDPPPLGLTALGIFFPRAVFEFIGLLVTV